MYKNIIYQRTSSCNSADVHIFVEIFNDILTQLRLYLNNEIIDFIHQFRNTLWISLIENCQTVSNHRILVANWHHLLRLFIQEFFSGPESADCLLIKLINERSFQWFYGFSSSGIWTLYEFKAKSLCKLRKVVDPLSPTCCGRVSMDILESFVRLSRTKSIFYWGRPLRLYLLCFWSFTLEIFYRFD